MNVKIFLQRKQAAEKKFSLENKKHLIHSFHKNIFDFNEKETH